MGAFSKLVRGALVLVLAIMMVARLGPSCEAMANAATPVMAAAMNCATPTGHAPKKAMLSICPVMCTALPGATLRHNEFMPFVELAPCASAVALLTGMSRAPTTPPPQWV